LAAAMGFPLALISTKAMSQESAWEASANVALYSEYRFRGVKQTEDAPAIQGGFDLAHSGGFYLGNWNSNVEYAGTSMEMDFYGGYAFEVGDLSVDIGDLYYYYPDKVGDDVNSNEIYAILGYGPVSLGVHYFTTDWYGADGTDGTTYTQINFEYPLSDTVTFSAHAGTHSVEGDSSSDYEDYSVSIAWDIGNGYGMGVDFIDNSGDAASSDGYESAVVVNFSKSM
jgi:uncharacterized protein (TIGR02001 family)